MKIYLCGPIADCTDAECKDWREEVKKLWPDECSDPMDRDYRNVKITDKDIRDIVEGDKKEIDGCNAIIVYYSKPSVGTSMEILYAWENTKLVILVNPDFKNVLSPWLMYHNDGIFGNVKEAVNHLIKIRGAYGRK